MIFELGSSWAEFNLDLLRVHIELTLIRALKVRLPVQFEDTINRCDLLIT